MRTHVRIGMTWLALLLGSLPLLAQTLPSLIWQKALGGSRTDVARAITATADGGLVAASCFTMEKRGSSLILKCLGPASVQFIQINGFNFEAYKIFPPPGGGTAQGLTPGGNRTARTYYFIHPPKPL